MNTALRIKLERFSNGQWSVFIIALIFVSMVAFAVEPIARVLCFIIMFVVSVRASYEIAKVIDWFDDNVHSKVEMTRLYHLVYAIGVSMLIGIVFAYIGANVYSFSPQMYVLIEPRVIFFGCGFVASAIGYFIAWQAIPNKKERSHA